LYSNKSDVSCTQMCGSDFIIWHNSTKVMDNRSETVMHLVAYYAFQYYFACYYAHHFTK